MKRRNILIILGVVITILVVSLVAFFVFRGKTNENEEEPTEILELDKIPEYGYSLEDRDTELYKTTFESLRRVLSEDEIDYEEYAKLLSELYIVDLYTISNKMNHYDVGSTDFVVETAKETFELKVRDTLYKYVEDNSYGKRTQELPEVASIETTGIEDTKVKLGDQTYDGYEVTLTWTYAKDLGYDTSSTVSLARIEDKLYVTNQSASN